MTASLTQSLARWLGDLINNPAAGTILGVVILLAGMIAIAALVGWLISRNENNDTTNHPRTGQPGHPARSSNPAGRR